MHQNNAKSVQAPKAPNNTKNYANLAVNGAEAGLHRKWTQIDLYHLMLPKDVTFNRFDHKIYKRLPIPT